MSGKSLAALATIVALGGALRACGGEPETDNAASGGTSRGGTAGQAGGAAKGGTAGSNGGTGGASGAGGASGQSCAPLPRPPHAPDGWEPWTGWSCDCPMYVPGATGALPPPIEWEPCGPQIPDFDCRRTKTSWGPNGFLGDARFGVDPATGTAWLQHSRVAVYDGVPARTHLIADIDGPARSALYLENDLSGCVLFHLGLGGNRFAYKVIGDKWKDDKTVEGWIGGPLDAALPESVAKYPAAATWTSHWSISSDWVQRIELGIAHGYPWAKEPGVTLYKPSWDADSLPLRSSSGVGGDSFLVVGGSLAAGVWTWNEALGARPLIRWPGDGTRGADFFQADGVDMAWIYKEGKAGVAVKGSFMTAPYSTDAATVAATSRRLRSYPPDGYSSNIMDLAIGCGYTAHAVSSQVFPSNSLIVVRIADGVSWELKAGENQRPAWTKALGFTCDELFALVSFGNGATSEGPHVVRIRLDSLGPGLPPDL